MKNLYYVCMVLAIVSLGGGVMAKYLTPIAGAKPLSYIALSQTFLLFGLNFLLVDNLKK